MRRTTKKLKDGPLVSGCAAADVFIRLLVDQEGQTALLFLLVYDQRLVESSRVELVGGLDTDGRS